MKILITGATRGIGQAAAVELARQGHELVLIARDQNRADETILKIVAANMACEPDVLFCDLSSQAEIRKLAAEVKQKHPAFDVLINNAGGMFPARKLTVDGLEQTFAINHLGYFLLTNLLLDNVQKRVVSVSSGAHMGGHLDFDDLMFERRAYAPVGLKCYQQSKLCNILFTRELARRTEGKIIANCMHPGFVDSGFGHQEGGLLDFGLKLMKPFMLSPEQGADTIVWLATSPEVADKTGLYFIKRKIKKGSTESRDLEKAKKLWEVSEKLTGLAA